MKVTLILKKSVTRYDTESQATIYARLRDGRQLDLDAPTRLTINPNLWDDKAEQVKSKVVCDETMRTRYNNEARRLKTYIERAYQNRPDETVSKGWLKEALDQYYNPQKYNLEQVSAIKPTLTALFDEFLEKHRLSEVRKKNYRVIKRALQRYELYIRGYPDGEGGLHAGCGPGNGRHPAGHLELSGKRVPLLRHLSRDLRGHSRSPHAATSRQEHAVGLLLAYPNLLLLVQQS